MDSLSLQFLLIYNNHKYARTPRTSRIHFLEGEFVHGVEKANNVLLIGRLPM